MSERPPRVYVAGHRGMVGSAIVRALEAQGGVELVTRSRSELDLRSASDTLEFLGDEHIDAVYLAAARVGGIAANNDFPADFIYDNLAIAANVIHGAHAAGVGRLLFLGSSCIYPREADQPMSEEALLTGPLEPTNEPYAIAKIAGIKLCESYRRQHGDDFRSVMPTNLYGPGDNFDLETSHVLPALLRKFHQATLDGASEVPVWGSGRPKREFLHADDLAEACLFVMSLGESAYWGAVDTRCSHLNVGTGKDCSIRELAETIAHLSGFDGEIVFDPERPDGTPRKLLDVSKLAGLGWRARIPLEAGLADARQWMLEHWDEITSKD